MTWTFGDAAYPAAGIDVGLDGFAFYIGGDTPHPWTDAEIAALVSRFRMPIFTRSNPVDAVQAANDAADAIAWLRAHNVPARSALALDYETAINGAYVTAFDRMVFAAGWRTLLYGSLSTVMQNPRPSAGYWTASWSGVAHLDAGAAMTQWASDKQLGKPYDLSEVADSLVLWDTQGDTMTIEWTDTITGPNGRPGGNTVADTLTDLGRLRDALAGDPTALAAYGADSPLQLLIAMAEAFPALVAAVKAQAAPDPAAFVAALVANPDALAKLGAAIKLPTTVTLSGTETGTLS